MAGGEVLFIKLCVIDHMSLMSSNILSVYTFSLSALFYYNNNVVFKVL